MNQPTKDTDYFIDYNSSYGNRSARNSLNGKYAGKLANFPSLSKCIDSFYERGDEAYFKLQFRKHRNLKKSKLKELGLMFPLKVIPKCLLWYFRNICSTDFFSSDFQLFFPTWDVASGSYKKISERGSGKYPVVEPTRKSLKNTGDPYWRMPLCHRFIIQHLSSDICSESALKYRYAWILVKPKTRTTIPPFICFDIDSLPKAKSYGSETGKRTSSVVSRFIREITDLFKATPLIFASSSGKKKHVYFLLSEDVRSAFKDLSNLKLAVQDVLKPVFKKYGFLDFKRGGVEFFPSGNLLIPPLGLNSRLYELRGGRIAEYRPRDAQGKVGKPSVASSLQHLRSLDSRGVLVRLDMKALGNPKPTPMPATGDKGTDVEIVNGKPPIRETAKPQFSSNPNPYPVGDVCPIKMDNGERTEDVIREVIRFYQNQQGTDPDWDIIEGQLRVWIEANVKIGQADGTGNSRRGPLEWLDVRNPMRCYKWILDHFRNNFIPPIGNKKRKNETRALMLTLLDCIRRADLQTPANQGGVLRYNALLLIYKLAGTFHPSIARDRKVDVMLTDTGEYIYSARISRKQIDGWMRQWKIRGFQRELLDRFIAALEALRVLSVEQDWRKGEYARLWMLKLPQNFMDDKVFYAFNLPPVQAVRDYLERDEVLQIMDGKSYGRKIGGKQEKGDAL